MLYLFFWLCFIIYLVQPKFGSLSILNSQWYHRLYLTNKLIKSLFMIQAPISLLGLLFELLFNWPYRHLSSCLQKYLIHQRVRSHQCFQGHLFHIRDFPFQSDLIHCCFIQLSFYNFQFPFLDRVTEVLQLYFLQRFEIRQFI